MLLCIFDLQCTSVLDIKHGVCKDADLSRPDSTQLLEARKINSLTAIKFRRQLTKSDEKDLEYTTTGPLSVIFAIGKLLNGIEGDLGFHRIWNKADKFIDFSKPTSNCKDFVIMKRTSV